jgi:hypothetical protein
VGLGKLIDLLGGCRAKGMVVQTAEILALFDDAERCGAAVCFLHCIPPDH